MTFGNMSRTFVLVLLFCSFRVEFYFTSSCQFLNKCSVFIVFTIIPISSQIL